ncbi:hypothetical protein ACQEVG_26465 [Streptomyces sp. CA-135486]|uniref:DUF7919 family protein n=1 Tax=Streptomyces sp. CA-135486 TaxID=3240049 RepID=UPI003D904870
MTYFEDLTPYSYADEGMTGEPTTHWRGMPVVNVGWLSRRKRFPKCAPPQGLVDALAYLTREGRVLQTRGYHFCPWCFGWLVGARDDCPRGSAEIRVMGNGVAYAAPELVAHYVKAHHYRPPAEFVRAVMEPGG